MILSRYLMRAFLARFVGLLLGLVLFLQTLDLLAQANEVLAGGGAPLDSMLRYVMLRAPSLVETVAPLAGLLGALTALVTLAKNSEVLAMRAAGRSVLSLVGGLVAVGTALSILLFVFSETVVVRTNGMLEDWRDAGFKPDGQMADGENSWLMEDDTVVRVGHVMRGGTELVNIRLLIRGDEEEIIDIIDIERALWTQDRWDLSGVRRIGGTNSLANANATLCVLPITPTNCRSMPCRNTWAAWRLARAHNISTTRGSIKKLPGPSCWP
jgi:lipopolysaccharide export system permease protein